MFSCFLSTGGVYFNVTVEESHFFFFPESNFNQLKYLIKFILTDNRKYTES